MRKELELYNIKVEESYEKIREGYLDRNWSADLMKTIWGPDLASNINDNQNKQ